MTRRGTQQWRQQDKIKVLKLMGKVAGSVQPNLTRPDTAADDLSQYGGDQLAQDASSALKWLQLARMETNEDWQLTQFLGVDTSSFDFVNFREGSSGRKVIPNAAEGRTSWLAYSPAKDFTADGRFTADDFVTVEIFISDITKTGATTGLGFYTGSSDIFYATHGVQFTLVSGWNYVAVKRSDFTASGSPDWTSIASSRVLFESLTGAGEYATFDNLQIIKGDPNDGTRPNATGGHWQFTE